MRKRFMQLAAAALAFCLSVPSAKAVTTNHSGEIMIRVGLASSSTHVPTGELEAAHLENEYGAGYRFGYYDSNLNFVELGRTSSEIKKAAVLKTENLYYGYLSTLRKNTYSASINSDIMVGCWHVQLSGSYSSFETAATAASGVNGAFVAWIKGEYQVRVGAYGSKSEAETALNSLGQGTIVGTSAYGVSIVETGTSRMLFQYDNGSSTALAIQPDVTGAKEVQTWFSGYKYRGGFQYQRRTGGNLTVVNIVTLEDYVNGVICFEMGREWPLEALKAQAMCARTYVLKNLNKHNSYGFDICPSTGCQVYHGMGDDSDNGPSETSLQAVAETAGMVVRYNGKLAETPYSSSFGGASEDAKLVWGTDTDVECPYLRGVEDPYEADLNDRNPRSPWTVSYTSAQLTQQLQKQGMGTGTSVDRLDLTYSKLGNVIQVVVHWANGKSNTISASNIRKRFGVDAIRFTVNGVGAGSTTPPSQSGGNQDIVINGSTISGGLDGKYAISGSGMVSPPVEKPYIITGTGSVSALETGGNVGGSNGSSSQPTNETVTVSGSTYTFNGGGFGHQLGMSQFGANAMARHGFTYDQIISFYYPGVKIEHF